MKKITLGLSLILAAIVGAGIGYKLPKFNFREHFNAWRGSVGVPDRAPKFPEHWRERVAFFELLEGSADTAMLGDSITEFGEWSELLEHPSVINRGISGDTSKGVSDRLDALLRTRPKRVFLMIGINDIAKGAKAGEVVEESSSILKRLKDAGAQPFYQSVIPLARHSSLFSDQEIAAMNEQVRSANAAMLKHCQQNGIPYIDLNGILAPSGFLEDQYTTDGIHLNGLAYKKWAETISTLGLDLPPNSASRRLE